MGSSAVDYQPIELKNQTRRDFSEERKGHSRQPSQASLENKMQPKQLKGIRDPEKSMKFVQPLIGITSDSSQERSSRLQPASHKKANLVLTSGRSEDSNNALTGTHLMKTKTHQFPVIQEEEAPQNFFQASTSAKFKAHKGKGLRETGMESLRKVTNIY